MDGQEGPVAVGKEELVSSWQDLRGKNLPTGEQWENISGGRHIDVVALDGGMEAFSGLACKADDHHAGGFLTVCKEAAPGGMGSSPEAAKACQSLSDSPKSTHEQVCFDDEEAELLPANKPMQFEGADCVHATRPQEAVEAVPDVDEDHDAEHEASSLTGSDHEYAFIFEKPLSSLAADNYTQDGPETGRSPAWASLEASRQAAMPPTPPPTPQETLPGPHAPSPPPPAAELAGAPQDRGAHRSAALPDAEDVTTHKEELAGKEVSGDGKMQEQNPLQLPAGILESNQVKNTDVVQKTQAGMKGVAEPVADNAAVERAGGNAEGAKEPDQAGKGRQPHGARGDAAEAWQRSLDEVGVIPGGRAAFGAPPPALQPQPAAPGPGTGAAAPPPRAVDGHGAVPGGRAAFGAPVPAAGAAAMSASSWRTAGVERPPIGRAPGGSPVRLLPQLHLQTVMQRAVADIRPLPRLVARAVPGDMLESFDRLWHGSGVVASQS